MVVIFCKKTGLSTRLSWDKRTLTHSTAVLLRCNVYEACKLLYQKECRVEQVLLVKKYFEFDIQESKTINMFTKYILDFPSLL